MKKSDLKNTVFINKQQKLTEVRPNSIYLQSKSIRWFLYNDNFGA